jgi:hypothetical protein
MSPPRYAAPGSNFAALGGKSKWFDEVGDLRGIPVYASRTIGVDSEIRRIGEL